MAEHLERPGKAAFRPHAEVLHPGKSSIELLWAQNSPAYPSRMPGFIWKRCVLQGHVVHDVSAGALGPLCGKGTALRHEVLHGSVHGRRSMKTVLANPSCRQSFEGQHDSQHQSNIARAPLFLQLRDPTAPEHHPLGAGLSRCVTFALLG